MRVLCDEIRNREIDVLEFSPAVELLLDDQEQCVGAVLFNFDTEQYCVVQSKTTLIATGELDDSISKGFQPPIIMGRLPMD